MDSPGCLKVDVRDDFALRFFVFVGLKRLIIMNPSHPFTSLPKLYQISF